MTLSREQIKSAALELDPREREALAEELLLSIDGANREEIDAAWLDESRRRDAAYREGKSRATSVDDVVARLKGKSS